MIDSSKKRTRQLAFELHNSHVCEKRSNANFHFKSSKLECTKTPCLVVP